MKLSVVIPAYNEGSCIEVTVKALCAKLSEEKIPHEILIIYDESKDDSEKIIKNLVKTIPEVLYINNGKPQGYGTAVRKGLESINGEVAVIVMADGSDSPDDVVVFYKHILEGYDCVFGSRFIKGGKTTNYPLFKLVLNRFFNFVVKVVFGLKYNDITNAFKMYRASVIPGLKPFLSKHFNLTVELPLKAIIRGYSYTVVPNSWINRDYRESNLRIKEMGSRYFFILIYCFIEKWLSRGDFLKGKIS